MELHTLSLSQDMTLLHLPEQRFRTVRVTGVFAVPLRQEDAAAYAVLPGLLTRRCRRLPTTAALSRRLEELYGASVEAGVNRLGQWQVLRFSISFLCKAYTLNKEDLTEDCTRLLLDMLFDPALEEDVFPQTDFEQEKRCLLERLQAEINDKRRYACHQCEALLGPEDALSVNPLGTPQTVEALTPVEAAAARERLLSTARIHWLCQGVEDVSALTQAIHNRFAGLAFRKAVSLQADVAFTVKESQRTDEMDVQQAKLVLGYRVAVTEPDDQVMAARLMCSLWGGCPSSLLFRHVREEQSLCYYCAASYDRFHGVVLVDSGVQTENVPLVKQEVQRQLEAIRHGEFSDEELEAARLYLIQHFTSLDDTPAGRESYYVGQTVYDNYLTPDAFAGRMLAVTREDVCRAAQLTHLDSTYLLRPVEEVSV